MEPTTSTTARDELAQIIFDSRRPWVTKTEHRLMEQQQADAIIAAGYRKTRTVSTVAELDTLPFESVITDSYGTPYVCERHRLDGTGNEWCASGTSYLQESQYVLEHGDVTVHYTPEPSA